MDIGSPFSVKRGTIDALLKVYLRGKEIDRGGEWEIRRGEVLKVHIIRGTKSSLNPYSSWFWARGKGVGIGS